MSEEKEMSSDDMYTKVKNQLNQKREDSRLVLIIQSAILGIALIFQIRKVLKNQNAKLEK